MLGLWCYKDPAHCFFATVNTAKTSSREEQEPQDKHKRRTRPTTQPRVSTFTEEHVSHESSRTFSFSFHLSHLSHASIGLVDGSSEYPHHITFHYDKRQIWQVQGVPVALFLFTFPRMKVPIPNFPINNPTSFVHTGGGVAVRYENYERSLIAAGNNVKVLSPDRRSVETSELSTTSRILPDGIRGVPFTAMTMKNMSIIASAMNWCDVVIMPENTQMVTLSLLTFWYNRPGAMNVHTNVGQMLATGYGKFMTAVFEETFYFGIRNVQNNPWLTTYTTSDHNKQNLLSHRVRVNGVFELETREVVDMPAEKKRATREMLAPGIPDGALIVLFAGRFLKEKRADRLVATIPDGTALVLVGKGLEDFVSQFHNPDKLIFVHDGFVPNDVIYQYYQAVDWVANASAFETFGNTSFEANSVGTPCILHPKGGHLSQIENEGENGWFVDFDRADDVVREEIHGILYKRKKPSKEKVVKGMTRKLGAVSIHDLVTQTVASHQKYKAERSGGVWNKCVSCIRLLMLFLPCLINVLLECFLLVIGGYKHIEAENAEDFGVGERNTVNPQKAKKLKAN